MDADMNKHKQCNKEVRRTIWNL